jgi:hypothetical protein
VLSWINGKAKTQKAHRFPDDARSWYQHSQAILNACDDALHSRDVWSIDIPAVFSEVDRRLWFALNGRTGNVRRTLRQRSPALARRFSQASREIIDLRNQTYSFLVRCRSRKGLLGAGAHDAARPVDYYRALEEVGFAARQAVARMERELAILWQEMSKLDVQVEQV